MLEKQRQELDTIDQQLTTLFEKRMRLAEEIAQIKKENNLEILDVSRETKVLEKVVGQLENPEFEPLLRELYEEIMRLSRQVQLKWLDNHPE